MRVEVYLYYAEVFRVSEPWYAYKRYAYKKECI